MKRKNQRTTRQRSPVRKQSLGYAGGAATAAGTEYHAHLLAWLMTLLLAETSVAAPWGLPANDTIVRVASETSNEVDDIEINSSRGHRVVAQAKTGLKLSTSIKQPLAKALRQFVRAELAGGNEKRLVLAAGPGARARISNEFAKVLTNLRTLADTDRLKDAAKNAMEQSVLRDVIRVVKKVWRSETKTTPSEEIIKKFLCRIEIDANAARTDDHHRLVADHLLRSSVLVDPQDAAEAWLTLVGVAFRITTRRGSVDLAAIRQALQEADIAINAPRSLQADVAKLRRTSQATIQRLDQTADLRIAGKSVWLRRHSMDDLTRAARRGHVVVVGSPGAGKSALLTRFALERQDAGETVVFLDTADLPLSGAQGLRAELELKHSLVDVLTDWPGTEARYLVLDALDGARGISTQSAWNQIITSVAQRAPGWRIVASVREFELAHDSSLRMMFPQPVPGPPNAAQNAAFADTHHVFVPEFNDEELSAVISMSSHFAALFDGAGAALRELLRNAFNLRLATELLEGGVDPSALSGVSLRVELLRRFWRSRVEESIPTDDLDAREIILRRACESMILGRRLLARRNEIAQTSADSRPLSQVLQCGVLRENDVGMPGGATTLLFSHHVLFDFAAAHLILGRSENVAHLFREQPDLVLMLRPSLVLFLEWLWRASGDDSQHRKYWDTAIELALPGIRPVVRVIATSVAARLARGPDDFGPLSEAMVHAQGERRLAAHTVFDDLARAVTS